MWENDRDLRPSESDQAAESARKVLQSESLFPRLTLKSSPTELTAADRAAVFVSALDKNKDGKIDSGELDLAPDYLKTDSRTIASRFQRVANLSNDDWGSEKNLSKADLTAFFNSSTYKITKLEGNERAIADELTKAFDKRDFDEFLVTMKKLHGKPAEANAVLPLLSGILEEVGYNSTFEVNEKGCSLVIGNTGWSNWSKLSLGSSGTADIKNGGRRIKATAREVFEGVSADFSKR
ncbi:MAG: hypothetical protein K2W95_22850 [Candidatus Obscuribacterales bacterium]|nr:hypothetical protein [Candidatus Obscuribacterales bacterium]